MLEHFDSIQENSLDLLLQFSNEENDFHYLPRDGSPVIYKQIPSTADLLPPSPEHHHHFELFASIKQQQLREIQQAVSKQEALYCEFLETKEKNASSRPVMGIKRKGSVATEAPSSPRRKNKHIKKLA